MDKFISTMFKYKKFIYFVLSLIVVFGIFSFKEIAKREFPNTAVPLISVSYIAPGYTSEEIFTEIVPVIESDIKDLDDVDQVFTYAFDNGGNTFVQFDLDVLDITQAQDELDKALLNADLDDGVTVTTSTDFKEAQVVYAITGEDRVDASKELMTQISNIDNVKDVELSGVSTQNVIFNVDKEKLDYVGISYVDFINYMGAIGTDLPLGYLQEDEDSIAFISNNNFTSVEDISDYVIGLNPETGEPIKLESLGSFSTEEASEQYYSYNQEDAVFLSVYFEDHLDYTQLGKDVTSAVEDFDYEGDYQVNPLVYQPDSVNEQITSIFVNLGESILLVVLIVMIGLGFKNSILIGITLPFTVLATILTLYVFGLDLQQISIAGFIISIGIIVDNSIVINDAIQHKLDNDIDIDNSITESVKENFIPILTSTATTIASFTPIIFLTGIAGKMVFSLPVTVIIALIYSFIFSMLITPILAHSFLKKKKLKVGKRKSRFNLEFLKSVIVRPWISIAIFFSGIILIVVLFLSMEIIIFPTAEKDIIYIEYTTLNSTDVEDTKEYSNEVIDYINTLDYASEHILYNGSVVAGRMPQYYSTLPTLPLQNNQGYIYLQIDDKDVVTDVKQQLDIDLNEEFDSELNISAKEVELNTPTAPIVITINGRETEELNDLADKYIGLINDIDGVDSATTVKSNLVLKYELEYNISTLQQIGTTQVEVEQEIASLVNDVPVEILDIESKDDNLILRSDVKSKDDLLNNIFVINGESYKGSDLFKINETTSYDQYTAINYENSVQISVYLDQGASVYSVQPKIDDLFAENDPELYYDITGESDLAVDVFSSVGVAGAIALVVIFLILLLQFNSFKNSLLILITIPLAMVGSFLAIFIAQIPFTFTAALGLTSLMGIVVNNGILLLSYMKEYEKEYDELLDVCYEAIKRRFRPIVLSNATTVIGLVPLIISGGEFFSPMAIALAGGLIVGAMLTIIFVPSMYYLLNKRRFNKEKENK